MKKFLDNLKYNLGQSGDKRSLIVLLMVMSLVGTAMTVLVSWLAFSFLLHHGLGVMGLLLAAWTILVAIRLVSVVNSIV